MHSNIEATNTVYGNGSGGNLPPDASDGIIDGISSTHLLNFAPGIVTGTVGEKPMWFYDSTSFPGFGIKNCYLGCHGIDMSSCVYEIPPAVGNIQCGAGC